MAYLRFFSSIALISSMLAGCPDDSDEVMSTDASVSDAQVSGSGDAGVFSAYVSFNVAPNANCSVDAKFEEHDKFIATGSYDVSHAGSDDFCTSPYYTNLIVVTNLTVDDEDGKTDSGTRPQFQIHSAEVLLTTLDGEAIAFKRGEQKLPNPFLVTTHLQDPSVEPGKPLTAVTSLVTIPAAYGALLGPFAGAQIVAEIELYGDTRDFGDVSVKKFKFPIEICKGCLDFCASKRAAETSTTECNDNAGADGRVCIDPGC